MAVAFAMFVTANARAACTGPAGNEGDQVYAANNHVMVFCNGTDWMSMGGGTPAASPATVTPGTLCGWRSAQCNGGVSSYSYNGNGVPCNGQTLTIGSNGCTYYPGGDYYLPNASTFVPSNCPSGFTGIVANNSGAPSFTCAKN